MITIGMQKQQFREFKKPFRLWVFDDYLEDELAEKLASSFPVADSEWYEYNNIFEKKRAMDDLSKMPLSIQNILAHFNMNPFIKFLENLTGIEGLIGDPALRGGGCHQIFPGGKLDIHADFNFHKHLKLDRRLNVLLYLNPKWHSTYGGYLECWDKDMKECHVRILPILNRMVVFETTDFSYHGHPDPLTCPNDRTRNSLAWYFYTNGRPEHEKSLPHSTQFQKRPSDETSEEIELLRQRRNEGRLVK